MVRDKCFICNKQKNNVKVRASNQRLCDNCAVSCNEADSGQVVGDNRNNSSASLSDATFEASLNDPVKALMEEVKRLQHTVTALQHQVSYLLTFVGAVDCNPGTANNAGDCATSNRVYQPVNASSDTNDSETNADYTSSASAVCFAGTVTNDRKYSVSQSRSTPLCQAVTTAVYIDMQNSESKTKNIIVTGLKESAECPDKDLAMELFSTEFDQQPNISYCRRLGKHELTDDRKVRPLLIAFDSSQTAQHFVMNAKLLRRSSSDVVREHVYINRDLTKAQSQAAYELRCRRRAASVQRRSKQHHQTPPPATTTTTRITRSQDITHRLPTTCGDNLNPAASTFQPSSGITDGHDN